MLDHSTWEEVEALPSSATYKEKLNAKRRILIQEDEDDDTDVVFWDEHTRPEDIMEGADLEDYYATQRALFKNDTSSTDGEQKKQLQELSRMLGINPKDVDGYHTFFEENQSMDDGASDELSSAFEYCDSLFQSHPELQQDYARWKHTLDRVSAMDVKTGSKGKRTSGWWGSLVVAESNCQHDCCDVRFDLERRSADLCGVRVKREQAEGRLCVH